MRLSRFGVCTAAAADLAVAQLTVTPNPVTNGSLTVTIVGQNAGDASTQYEDYLYYDGPDPIEVDGVACSQPAYQDPSGVECDIPSGMMPGAQVTMTVNATIDQLGTFNDNAVITGADDYVSVTNPPAGSNNVMSGSFTVTGLGGGESGGGDSGGAGGGSRGGSGGGSSGGGSSGGGSSGSGQSPGGGTSTPIVAPRIGRPAIAPATFRAASSGSSLVIAATAHPNLTFALDQAATMHFSLERATSGRLVGGRCTAATPTNGNHHICTRYVGISGSASVSARAGTNQMRVTGRVGARKLAPGHYLLMLRATNTAGMTSTSAHAAFTIIT